MIYKFRGKTLDNKWVYGNLFVNDDDYSKYYIIKPSTLWITESEGTEMRSVYTSNCIEVIPKTVGQYTNINDKNDKEIYTNDIVNGGTYNGSLRLGVIVYKDGKFFAEPLGRFAEGFCDDFYKFEVIGNIIDNPELGDVEKIYGNLFKDKDEI